MGLKMARAFGLKVVVGGGMAYMLDIDASVGANAVNRRDDVLLAQYLLAVWMAYNKDPLQMPIIIAAPVVACDGICGPKTKGAIKSFEQAFPQVSADGKIDPWNIPMARASKIFTLNTLLFFAGGLRGGVPSLRVEFPKELLRPLYRP
jgi:hypothetical protein